MRARHGLFASVALGMTVGVSGLAQAEVKYDFTTIDFPGSIGTAVDGNSTHQISGQYDDAQGNTHGFFVSNQGVFTTFDVPVPGASTTSVNGINAKGALAGTYRLGVAQTPHGFFLDGGVFTPIDFPESVRTQVGFVNAHDQLVGSYRDTSQSPHGFIWSRGSYTSFDVDVPGATRTVAFGLNDKGEVVGDYLGADGNNHGFLKIDDDYTTLDFPGPGVTVTVGEGVNNRGQIVGVFVDVDGNPHGFVLDDGRYTQIDVPGGSNTQIFSINAWGQIAGAYDDVMGHQHGFVGAPDH